ncbi:4-aminobutyrate aminotransferase and related aminotransferases [Moorella thermoacetica Y72]|uniref:4-aminobutyrate aminotransferase and related aminotransferases n=1 Tax=Moorella thermoacetica Y72 TaxID=1325331 RepID=A0A0S6UFC6_NEOTH|nr:4-aminobutyrate aminotransferase and related aminotransferases [Moorella thermoacetica Y72]
MKPPGVYHGVRVPGATDRMGTEVLPGPNPLRRRAAGPKHLSPGLEGFALSGAVVDGAGGIRRPLDGDGNLLSFAVAVLPVDAVGHPAIHLRHFLSLPAWQGWFPAGAVYPGAPAGNLPIRLD